MVSHGRCCCGGGVLLPVAIWFLTMLDCTVIHTPSLSIIASQQSLVSIRQHYSQLFLFYKYNTVRFENQYVVLLTKVNMDAWYVSSTVTQFPFVFISHLGHRIDDIVKYFFYPPFSRNDKCLFFRVRVCVPSSAGLERDKFDNKTVTFEEHIKVEHNMWHYLFFIVLVKVKDSTEYTGPESYVAEMIRVRMYVVGDLRKSSIIKPVPFFENTASSLCFRLQAFIVSRDFKCRRITKHQISVCGGELIL